jgi:hypothetical protein
VTTTKASSAAYTALCEREGRWWVVTVPELASGGVTQTRTLDQVPAVVADLVATMTGVDRGSVEVNVRAHAGVSPDARRAPRMSGMLAMWRMLWPRRPRSLGGR